MAVVFVGLRFLSRWVKAAGLGWDDYLIAASLVSESFSAKVHVQLTPMADIAFH